MPERCHLIAALKATLGTVLCASSAYIFSMFLPEQNIRPVVPLLLLLMIVLIAHYCGAFSGVAGAIAAGFVLARFLFPPLGTLGIAETADRTALVAFEVTALIFAYLSAPAKSTLWRSR